MNADRDGTRWLMGNGDRTGARFASYQPSTISSRPYRRSSAFIGGFNFVPCSRRRVMPSDEIRSSAIANLRAAGVPESTAQTLAGRVVGVVEPLRRQAEGL